MSPSSRGRSAQASALRRRLWFSFLVAVVLGGGLGGLHLSGSEPAFLQEIEGRALDWRFRVRGPVQPPDSVVIVAVDDASLSRLGRWPLPRSTYAEAVRRLDEAGAAAIALDLLLLEPEAASDGGTLSPGDEALRQALTDAEGAVLAFAVQFKGDASLSEAQRQIIADAAYRVVETPAGSEGRVPMGRGALLPMESLAEVASLGNVTLILDGDGLPRRIHTAVTLGEENVPAFAVPAVRTLLGLTPEEVVLSLEGRLSLGNKSRWLDATMALPIDYYGPSGTIPTYSLADLLEGRLESSLFAGRLVVIGATAIGVGDIFATPFAGEPMPGVELHATAMANLLQERSLERPIGIERWEAASILAAALLAWIVVSLPNPRIATLLGLLVVLLWPLAAYLAFVEANLWLNLTRATITYVLTAALLAGGRTAHERRLRSEAERQRRNLARYVSPVMADQLASEDRPSFDRRLQEAAILFFDLSGSTAIAEVAGPEATATFLRDFHTLTEEVVTRHAGVIEQFAGDGVMVIFGLPQPRDDDPLRALGCARDLVRTLADWKPQLRSRVGLHFGPVAMARLGGATQAHVTAAGDTVNVASRLEALAKDEGWGLVASDALVQAVRQRGGELLLVGLEHGGDQGVRGRTGRLEVWRTTYEALIA